MSCDRESIRASVVQWFGDAETFESYVHGELHQHLYAPSYVSYKYVVFGSLPWFWCGVGGFIWHLRAGEELEAMYFVGYAACHAFMTVPVQTRLVFLAFAHCQPKSDARLEWARQVGKCAAFSGLTNFALLSAGIALDLLKGTPTTTALGLARMILAGPFLPMAALTLAVYWPDLRHYLRGGPAGPAPES